jgi:hypothetical protein
MSRTLTSEITTYMAGCTIAVIQAAVSFANRRAGER